MAGKIIFVDQRQLSDARLSESLSGLSPHTRAMLEQRTRYDPGIMSIYTRQPINTLPFRNDIIECLPLRTPMATPGLDFAEVTNRRCLDLRQNRFHRPWVVSWSGGIDSTVILVSILRNLPRADWGNITVACNRCSIWESPRFWQLHVEPNFAVIDSSELYARSCDSDCYIIDGEPGDQLYAGGMSQAMTCDDPDLLDLDLEHHADRLIDYVAHYRRSPTVPAAGREFAVWYHDLVTKDAAVNGHTLHTFHDFFWWNFFNLAWTSARFRAMTLGSWSSRGSADHYLDSMIHWYDSPDYQTWSMTSNRRGVKYGDTVGDYKRASKQYVTDFTRDRFWAKYKTKIYSDSLQMPAQRSWFCMLDDLSLLSLDRDLDQIRDLLPDHINSNS